MNEPTFPNIVNIGGLSYETKLDQILVQLNVSYSEYLWWNSNNKIRVTIPPELYTESTEDSGGRRASMNIGKAALQDRRSRSMSVKKEKTPNKEKDFKVMLTNEYIILFRLEFDK
jgi:hypothetical protein